MQKVQIPPPPRSRSLITRRGLLQASVPALIGMSALGGYAFAIEPRFRLAETTYRLTPPHWPRDLPLRIAILTDIHASEPYMSARRIGDIVARTNALKPDLTLLLGDFGADHRFQTRFVREDEWSEVLADLKAPLGVHAILGNHDWWDDHAAQARGKGPTRGGLALQKRGIGVFENDVVRLSHRGRSFWLAGLGDQIAFVVQRGRGWMRFRGVDDLDGTLAKITDSAPVIMMVHEPDIFVRMPSRVALTVAGHTHGGQVRLFGYSPRVPSQFGNRFAYGHIVENNRHMIVSGGLGCSILPVRFGMPPEIVMVELA